MQSSTSFCRIRYTASYRPDNPTRKGTFTACLSDIKVRINAAWEEVLVGQLYDRIIINHDGEDSDHWLYDPVTGNAGQILI